MDSVTELDNAMKGVQALNHVLNLRPVVGMKYPGSDGVFRNFAEDLYGLEYLGGGYYSAVYGHKSFPNLVIKVGFNGNEDASAAYLAWSRHNGGPHVPHVSWIGRGEQGVYFAVLDKLYDEPPVNNGDSQSAAITRLHKVAPKWGTIKGYGLHRMTSDQRTWFDIIQFFTGVASFDLHSENIMFDRNGRVVITDPVGESTSPEAAQEVEEKYGVVPYKEAA